MAPELCFGCLCIFLQNSRADSIKKAIIEFLDMCIIPRYLNGGCSSCLPEGWGRLPRGF